MELNLSINPIPCPRPRIAVRGRFPVAYYPKTYQTWKALAGDLIRLRVPLKRPAYLDGPLALFVTFNVPKPKSTKLDAPKPDIDNYLKSLMDACTAAGVWTDDCQIVFVHARKRWATEGSILATIQAETP